MGGSLCQRQSERLEPPGWPGLEGQIYPGREWRIQEGHRLVGKGRIMEVLDSRSECLLWVESCH